MREHEQSEKSPAQPSSACMCRITASISSITKTMAGILYRSANISFKGIRPKRKYAFIVACYSPSPRPAPLFADASSSLMPPPASSPRIWYQTLPNRRVSPDDGISCILRRFRRYGFLIVFQYCLSTFSSFYFGLNSLFFFLIS